MEKVKVTQAQADLIKSIKDTDYAINIHGLNKRPDSSLQELTTAELARALYVGYEVEPEYSVGDWVRDAKGEVIKVTEVDRGGILTDGGNLRSWYGNRSDGYRSLKHATPEEIAKEKERRWWAKHGRDVWELRKGDVIGINIKTITINEVREHGYIAYFDGLGSDRIYSIDSLKSGGYKIVCFAEDRKDV